jgi:hypothetical protein
MLYDEELILLPDYSLIKDSLFHTSLSQFGIIFWGSTTNLQKAHYNTKENKKSDAGIKTKDIL